VASPWDVDKYLLMAFVHKPLILLDFTNGERDTRRHTRTN
jgi:hypothetical protein